MRVDFPGSMRDFKDLSAGEFFVYFEDKARPLAMKIFDDASPDKPVAVLSFSTAAHPSMTPPTILLGGQFQNRSVLVIPGVSLRPVCALDKRHTDSPSLDRPGPIIFAVGATMIRAFSRSGGVDVDLTTGAAQVPRAYPGSTWVDDWAIIVHWLDEEIVLCARGKPAEP
jgi:hypothetical protein